MRVLHAADIHLDSPLHGLSAYPDAPAQQLRNASREALSQLVVRAIDEAVDFVVIAGDLYDGNWRDYNTGLFFSQQMGRLRRHGIPVFLVYGNHDAENDMTLRLTLPDNVVAFNARKPETRRLDHLKVALHGQSFREKSVVSNLAVGYPQAVAGYYNIGVLHTALEGYAAHASYAPCARSELHARGYDYWALGHVHEFQQWDEQSTIVFPGNLQGRNVRECGRRGAVLVTVQDGQTQVERLFIDVLRWESLDIDVTGCAALGDAARRVGRALEDVLAGDAQVPRAVRVTLTGATPLHGTLLGRAREVRAEVINQVAALGHDRLWLERVRLHTTLPATGTQPLAGDAIDELRRLLDDAPTDPEFLALLEKDLQAFVGKVPAEVGDDAPLLQHARDGRLADLVRQVAPALLARVAAQD